eukprot:7168694-Pyramimonas_sp.AAC.1
MPVRAARCVKAGDRQRFSVKGKFHVMAPKCAITALPPSCEQLKNTMLEMGAEVNLDGLRAYVVRHGGDLVHSAFHAYQRQLLNWWPGTLLA